MLVTTLRIDTVLTEHALTVKALTVTLDLLHHHLRHISERQVCATISDFEAVA